MGGQDARVLAPEARAAAERLAGDLPDLAAGMAGFLSARIPEIRADATLRDLTLASCTSTLEVGLSMIRHGIPVERAAAPVGALEHARAMAARGLDIDGTLRFYRLGHAYFWELWVAALAEEIHDAARLADVLRETSVFSFAFLDLLSTRVNVELLAERDRRERRLTAAREELVTAIAAGEPVDAASAERTLGFIFGRRHVGFICWAEGAAEELERAAGDVAAALGPDRPLLVARSASEIWGWQHVPAAAADAGPSIGAAVPSGLLVALGSTASGLSGFRASHEQARRAQRHARLAGVGAPSVTRFEDIRFVDLLSRDLAAARAFVAAELGDLGGTDDRSAALRAFLQVFLDANGNVTATAASLGLHRNTARQRLGRAEALRGRPVTQRGSELRAALALAAALGEAVLGEDPVADR